MNEDKSQTSFSVELTADGSPTLRLPGDGESMHHSGGAAAETAYIYQRIISGALKILPDTNICVVGLGLGYIEISWAIEVLKTGSKVGVSTCRTYEIDNGLKEKFMNWLGGEEIEIYDQVCRKLDPECSVRDVKKLLYINYRELGIFGNLLNYNSKQQSYNVICYDAFSRKTNDQLWTEEFLTDFIATVAAPNCAITTYACTANLKRALLKNSFSLIDRPGFQGKRQSTLAARGLLATFDFYRTS